MPQLDIAVSVRRLRREDLGSCEWAGSTTHLAYVSEALSRAARGRVDYLAVCPPSDMPVAIGGVDFEVNPDAGTLRQLVVHPALRSCGLGTILVGACEAAIKRRGLVRAELSVDEDNPCARRLYQRLGYVECGRRPEEWQVRAVDGSVRRHRTVCVVTRKDM